MTPLRSRLLLVMTCLALPLLGACGGASRAAPERSDVEAGVRAVLDAQVRSWNRGDVEAFMEGYHRSDSVTFVSGDQVTRGWQTVLDRYKKVYGTPEKMGRLTFSELEVSPLDGCCALVIGRWKLDRAGDAPSGRFTLLFRQTASGWKIVHDHTSSAP